MTINKEKLISLFEASKKVPYSQEYLSLLVRKNKLEGFKKDGKWYTTKKALDEYIQRVAEANYGRQEILKAKIPAEENQKALANLKWALVLAALVIVSLVVWGVDGRRNRNQEFMVEKDAENNLIIYAEDPESVGTITVVPK